MGFGDVTRYANYDQQQPHGFGAVIYRQKQSTNNNRYQAPDRPSTLTAASAAANAEQRLTAAGVPVPQPNKHKNLLLTALDYLDRPGQAVRGAVKAAFTPEKESILGAAWEGFTGKQKTSGEDVLKSAGIEPKTKAGRFAASLGTEILLDPTTYLTLGTGSAAKQGAKALAKGIIKEVEQETGKKIAQESAERLAVNALKGEIPIGRLGTAVNRAMGKTAETKQIITGLGKITQTEQRIGKRIEGEGFSKLAKQAEMQAKSFTEEARRLQKTAKTVEPNVEVVRYGVQPKGQTKILQQADELLKQANKQKVIADQYKKLAKETKKAIKEIKVPKTIASVTELGENQAKTTLRFAGKPFLDVTPIRTKLGGTVQRLPLATKITDSLGRMFVFNYTPKNIQGIERELVTKAKDIITAGGREAAGGSDWARKQVVSEWAQSGLSERARKEASGVIEQTAKGTPEAQEAAARASQMFAEDAERMLAEGYPLNIVDNYVQHLYEDPPEVVKQVLNKWRQNKTVRGSRPGFMKERSIPTLEEAKAMGLHPIEDVGITTQIHRALTEQAVVVNKTGKELLRLGPKVIKDAKKAPLDWIRLGDTVPSLADKAVHPELKTAIAPLYSLITNNDEGVRLAMNLWNSAMGVLKGMLTSINPRFHIINFAGGVFNNMLDGVWNPLRYPQAGAVLTGAIDEVELAGRMVPTQVIREWFMREGLAGQGMFRDMAVTERRLLETAKKGLEAATKSIPEKISYGGYYMVRHPLESTRTIGEVTDSITRLANFLHHLDSGLSPSQAAKMTRTALYDYGALTETEKAIRKFAVPFYSWTRFNIPRMLERLISVPGVFTGTAHLRANLVNINEVDESHLPTYLRDQMAMPLWIDDKGNIHYINLSLPMNDLARIKDPRDFREAIQEVVSMINPIFTTPAQIAGNVSFLTGAPLTRTPDIPEAAFADYGKFTLQQLGPAREIAAAQKAAQGQDVGRVIGFGGMLPIVDPAKNARNDIYRQRELMQQAIDAAKRQGVDVPTTSELDQEVLPPTKGFAEVLSKTNGLTGFKSLASRSQLPKGISVPGVLKQSMKIAGVPEDWGPYLAWLMDHESGGDPTAVNPTPVIYDKKTGRKEHATGLFQTMPSTFKTYALPGHNDIWNPVDNTIAAIRYIQARYGHPANIPGIGKEGWKGY